MQSTRKENVIKYINRYKNQISKADNQELPQLVGRLYAYLLKKSVITDCTFIKENLSYQITQIINCYKTRSEQPIFEKTRLNKPLSKRQCDILDYYQNGYNITEIADELDCSTQTVNKHFKEIGLYFGLDYDEITESRMRKLIFGDNV